MNSTHKPRSPRIELRLYIAGESPNSVRALANVKAICRDWLPGRHHLEIVDVLEQPTLPLEDGVLVTPTLIIRNPSTMLKIVGDLHDRTEVLAALGTGEAAVE